MEEESLRPTVESSVFGCLFVVGPPVIPPHAHTHRSACIIGTLASCGEQRIYVGDFCCWVGVGKHWVWVSFCGGGEPKMPCHCVLSPILGSQTSSPYPFRIPFWLIVVIFLGSKVVLAENNRRCGSMPCYWKPKRPPHLFYYSSSSI